MTLHTLGREAMSEQDKKADDNKGEGEPTDEQIRLFTERLLAMGGVPGRFWP